MQGSPHDRQTVQVGKSFDPVAVRGCPAPRRPPPLPAAACTEASSHAPPAGDRGHAVREPRRRSGSHRCRAAATRPSCSAALGRRSATGPVKAGYDSARSVLPSTSTSSSRRPGLVSSARSTVPVRRRITSEAYASGSVHPLERLINLVALLLDTNRPLTFDEIRESARSLRPGGPGERQTPVRARQGHSFVPSASRSRWHRPTRGRWTRDTGSLENVTSCRTSPSPRKRPRRCSSPPTGPPRPARPLRRSGSCCPVPTEACCPRSAARAWRWTSRDRTWPQIADAVARRRRITLQIPPHRGGRSRTGGGRLGPGLPKRFLVRGRQRS